MRTLKITLSYDGTAYAGFQRQTRFPAIQNVVEDVLSRLCGEPVRVTGSGRTDAGVHALGQVVSFTTEGRIPTERFVRALNTYLPADIRALAAEDAPEGFNARKDVLRKEYLYVVQYTPVPDPFLRNYAWQVTEKPVLARLNRAASHILGTHDFSGFQSTGSVPVSPVKTIFTSSWTRCPVPAVVTRHGDSDAPERYVYRIAGDGFVYHMVRNLVWSMLQAGWGRKAPDALARELEAPRGAFENAAAPPQGLYLASVIYPDHDATETRRQQP
ncbi:MAG TPA: tRNA pseudouridine(38-40) synthase TruA [Acidaminococcaceae bacterium]|nr:tRNA pseudouridine(38-40) synthase TruA [Acidaminococcaceae bacterium]